MTRAGRIWSIAALIWSKEKPSQTAPSPSSWPMTRVISLFPDIFRAYCAASRVAERLVPLFALSITRCPLSWETDILPGTALNEDKGEGSIPRIIAATAASTSDVWYPGIASRGFEKRDLFSPRIRVHSIPSQRATSSVYTTCPACSVWIFCARRRFLQPLVEAILDARADFLPAAKE